MVESGCGDRHQSPDGSTLPVTIPAPGTTIPPNGPTRQKRKRQASVWHGRT